MLNRTEDIVWYDSLDDAAEESLTPIKCWSLLQFYRLKGKTSILSIVNMEPIPDLYYTVRIPQGDRFYKKPFRGYDIDTLYFYRRTMTFSGEDMAVENLRRFVSDGNVTLLYNTEQIEETKKMLDRVYKANINGPGKISYAEYLKILEVSLAFEDYKDVSKSLIGYRTVCDQFEKRIKEFWTMLYEKNNTQKK